jgi:carbamoyl-phosphate synthase large subunit
MPKRTDIKKILIIGSGPIVIGQACEFDYSGTQACKVLKEEGYEVILVNNNPATIMTDPELAFKTYIEPLTLPILEKIIEKERPQALLPTLGGQTGLNLATSLADSGILDQYGVELIGAPLKSIKLSEQRELFKEAMTQIGLEVPRSGIVKSIDEAKILARRLGYPLVIRPSFTLGGSGGGITYNLEELKKTVIMGLDLSPVKTVLIEESVIGWKEYELEVMRDKKDNVVIICSIENLDPMGIHTGDSITVAPAQTLTDKEYQRMRDAAIKIIRQIGVETGGSNIQFAINPDSGRLLVIEMNPRVSRSSALASKATGFPIAKIAAKLAVGYNLDEIPNDITKKTPACFEPALDYVVVKIPRFTFDKFPEASPVLSTQMKSVGEAMAIGRNYKEALQKGLRSLEAGYSGLTDSSHHNDITIEELRKKLMVPDRERVIYLKKGFELGMGVEEAYNLSKIDQWFLYQIKEIVDLEKELKEYRKENLDLFEKGYKRTKLEIPDELLLKAKKYGFSDKQLSNLLGLDEDWIRRKRKSSGIIPVFKTVDTCAGEFESYTPYFYSTYEEEDEGRYSEKKKIIILGTGPNRIGQGIEFDYASVHACMAFKEEGFETIMVNCNPETVSTDYDTPDRLYFEPITKEDVLNIVEKEKPFGVAIQFGGQTPLKLALDLEKAGVNIIGTSPENIDLAEDRKKFGRLVEKLGIPQPPNRFIIHPEKAKSSAAQLGYPVLIRPSYVLGGQAMQIVYDENSLDEYIKKAKEVSPEHSILMDKFIENAIEVEVDAVSDGEETFIGGIMEHIEEAGIHSGDSSCVLPPYSLSEEEVEKIKEYTKVISRELKIIGLLNIQYAIKNEQVYLLEVNPRASRTVPFVSKSIGIPLAKLAAKVMVDRKLNELLPQKLPRINHVSVKVPVFPFIKFSEVDFLLSPQMKSTGESMGIDKDLGKAFAKAYTGPNQFSGLPKTGTVFISVKNKDKRGVVFLAKRLESLGFRIVATSGTARVLVNSGIRVEPVYKVKEGRPNIVDKLKNKEIDLVINTPSDGTSHIDSFSIRRSAIEYNIPCITTLSGAQAAINAIEGLLKEELEVKALQDYFKE